MLFAVRVNFALLALGLNSNWIAAGYRQSLQRSAQAMGSTPQEAALRIAVEMAPQYRSSVNRKTLERWQRSGKIRPDHPGVASALILIEY